MSGTIAFYPVSGQSGYVGQEPHTFSIFQESWWLDAVAPNAWDAIEISSGDQVDARYTYHIISKGGVRAIVMPMFTGYMGPWVRKVSDRISKQTGFTQKALEEIIPQIPDVMFFRQDFHPQLAYWMPFLWAGYEGHIGQSHMIVDTDDYDAVFSRFSSSRRNSIRKAAKSLEITTNPDDDVLLSLVDQTYVAQGLRPLNHAVVGRIFEACRSRGRLLTWVARDEAGNVHASNAAIRDDHSIYGILMGYDRAYPKSRASELLLAEVIKYACDNKLKIDLMGSVVKSLEYRNLTFGATPEYHVNMRQSTYAGKAVFGLRKVIQPLFPKLR